MKTHKVGYFIGSLSSTSINRLLSKALIKLAPEGLEFVEIPFADLPLYRPEFDADYPAAGQGLQGSDRGGGRVAVRDPGIQPVDSRRAEERDRFRQPPVRQELVRAQALGGDRHLARRDRHRGRAAAPAQPARATAIRRR